MKPPSPSLGFGVPENIADRARLYSMLQRLKPSLPLIGRGSTVMASQAGIGRCYELCWNMYPHEEDGVAREDCIRRCT